MCGPVTIYDLCALCSYNGFFHRLIIPMLLSCAQRSGIPCCYVLLKTPRCFGQAPWVRKLYFSVSSKVYRRSLLVSTRGFNWGSPLPQAYILPKPTRFFQKARPIVNFSKAWPCRINWTCLKRQFANDASCGIPGPWRSS